jgi:hypothetical protein
VNLSGGPDPSETPDAGAARAAAFVRTAELPRVGTEARVALAVTFAPGIVAAWIVRRAAEIPPPPPRAWDAGASSDEIP